MISFNMDKTCPGWTMSNGSGDINTLVFRAHFNDTFVS